MALDPDDPRPPYLQLANVLRAAILSKRFEPGDQLPSGTQLSSRYGVARMTVQHALRVLRDEGLIVSRQGSGVFVRERTATPIGLRPVVERAFADADVTIDFVGLSGETLHGALSEPLDKIRAGQLTPDSIAVRMLLPDTSTPWALPCRAGTLEDDPDFRARSGEITRRHTRGIIDSVEELADLELVKRGTVEIRLHRSTPLFKLYILNAQEVFFGFYPVKEHRVTLDGERRALYDLMGKDAVLFHHGRDSDNESAGSLYVDQAQAWFDSMWRTVAREPTRIP